MLKYSSAASKILFLSKPQTVPVLLSEGPVGFAPEGDKLLKYIGITLLCFHLLGRLYHVDEMSASACQLLEPEETSWITQSPRAAADQLYNWLHNYYIDLARQYLFFLFLNYFLLSDWFLPWPMEGKNNLQDCLKTPFIQKCAALI